MKPITLHGHSRPLTQIKYNEEGDLLFSAAKDNTPSVWFSHNGERLGTYNGHNGAVWCLDVRHDSSLLVTGAADNSMRLWDVRTGTQLCSLQTKSAVRTCGWSYAGDRIFMTTDKAMRNACEIMIYSSSDLTSAGAAAKPINTIGLSADASKVTAAVWGFMDETIITGHENGDVAKWDPKTGRELARVAMHRKSVNDIQITKDKSMCITASKDFLAKLFDEATLEPLKEYKTERPVNSAAISSLREHVVVGGGQEAMAVTTTAGQQGKFEARLYHMVFEEEIGRIKGHFGPINTVAFHPDGKSYSSGGEDGYVRLHNFDPSYFDFEFEH